MDKALLLYILSLIARVIIGYVIVQKYGYEAFVWSALYTLLTVIVDVPEVR